EEIFYFEGQPKKPSAFGFVLHNRSHWSDIFPILVHVRNLKAHVVAVQRDIPKPPAKPLRHRWLKKPWIGWLWVVFKIYGVKRLLSMRRISKDRPTLLLLSADYDIRFLIQQVLKWRSFRLLYWQPGREEFVWRLFPCSFFPILLDSCDREISALGMSEV